METLDYNPNHWGKACPKYDCRKDICKCGLQKVVLPAALGDDSATSSIAPKNGAYCNSIVVYENNGHVYIYSKEGVPTLVETEGSTVEETIKRIEEELAQEVLDREHGDDALQQEIDDLKNSPDVVDIVATYAALQAYDTSKLGDNDIIRVLVDENHNGASTYYRWDKNNNTFVYIGEVGDYYTKGQVDTLLGGKQDKLTAGANISIDADNEISATDTTYSSFVGTDGVDPGIAGLVPAPATTDAGKFLKADGTWDTAGGGGGGSITELTSADYNYHLAGDTDDGVALWQLASGVYSCKDNVKIYYDNNGNNSTQASVYIVNHENNYPSAIQYCWASVQGDEAAGYIYGYSDNNGTLLGGAKKVGAIAEMIYADGVAKQRVAIGSSASSTKNDAIAIGTGAKAQGSNGSTAVGKNTTATGNYSTAIGVGGNVTRTYSIGIGGAVTTTNITGAVALGYGSNATRTGEVNIGSSTTAQGFNSTNYRVIGGVHDGQLAQDAATVNQVNATIDAINTALSINIPHIGA